MQNSGDRSRQVITRPTNRYRFLGFLDSLDRTIRVYLCGECGALTTTTITHDEVEGLDAHDAWHAEEGPPA